MVLFKDSINQSNFKVFKFSDLVPDNHISHLIRFIFEMDVFKVFDSKYINTAGQHAYSHSVIARTIVMGFILGIYNSSELERSVVEYSSLQYLLGKSRPDAETYRRFMRDSPEIFDLFDDIVKMLAKELDLFDLSILYADNTKIKANASSFKNNFNVDKVLSLKESYEVCKELGLDESNLDDEIDYLKLPDGVNIEMVKESVKRLNKNPKVFNSLYRRKLDNILDEIENDSVIYLEKSFNKFLKEQSKRLLIKAEKEGKDYNLDEIMNMITFDLENIINESYESIIDETCKDVSKKHFNNFVKSNNKIIMTEITEKAIKIEMVKNTKESIKAEIGSIKDKTVETLLKNILTKLSEKSLNINDLDAKWMPINNTPTLTNKNNMAHGYNCCFLVESNGYILSTYASQSPNDASSLKPVIDQYQTFFKTNNEPQINNEKEKLVVDNGYNNLNNLKFCEKLDIDLYTPTKNEAIITNKKYKHETIKIDSPLIFQKDPENKWLKCNQKKKLILIAEKRLPLAYNEIEQQTEYEYHTTECKNCPDKKECNKNQDEKTVKITITDTELKHEEKMKSEEAKEIYKKRKYKIEPIFGHSKHNKKFTQLITTKVENIGTVLKTFAATINLSKIHKAIPLTNKTEKSPRKIYKIFKSKQSTMDQYMLA